MGPEKMTQIAKIAGPLCFFAAPTAPGQGPLPKYMQSSEGVPLAYELSIFLTSRKHPVRFPLRVKTHGIESGGLFKRGEAENHRAGMISSRTSDMQEVCKNAKNES